MGDINIDTLNKHDIGYNSLVSVSDVCGLSNLVSIKSYFTKTSRHSIDVFLTNWPGCFQKTSVFERGISDYHGLVIPVMKSYHLSLKSKIIKYHTTKSLMRKSSCQM